MTVSAPTKGVSLSELAARISDCNVAKRTPFEFDAAGAGPTQWSRSVNAMR